MSACALSIQAGVFVLLQQAVRHWEGFCCKPSCLQRCCASGIYVSKESVIWLDLCSVNVAHGPPVWSPRVRPWPDVQKMLPWVQKRSHDTQVVAWRRRGEHGGVRQSRGLSDVWLWQRPKRFSPLSLSISADKSLCAGCFETQEKLKWWG